MHISPLDVIKEAEKKSEENIKKAQAEAEKTVLKTGKQRQKLVIEVGRRNKTKKDELLTGAQNEANKEIEELVKQ